MLLKVYFDFAEIFLYTFVYFNRETENVKTPKGRKANKLWLGRVLSWI